MAVLLSGLALVAWCGWVSAFHRSTSPARVTWAISFTAVVAVDILLWQGRHRRRPGLRLEPVRQAWPRPGQDRRRVLVGLAPWLGLLLIVVAWEVLGIDTGTHEPHLTISALSQAFRAMNAALLLFWMLVGFGYGAVRARAPLAEASKPQDGRYGALAVGHPAMTAPGLLLPSDRAVGVGFWVGLVVAAAGVDVVARRSKGRFAGSEDVLRLLTNPVVPKVLLVLAWTYSGYHLFAH